jgi:uncharacterized Zn finger protein
MNCSKCKGLVVLDVVLSESMYWIDMLRCVNCGKVQLNEAINYASKTKAKRINKLGELELYRSRSRNIKRSSNILQHQ